ncbi:MAG: sulfatase-like hydrolase/transferase [Acidobacteriota bacterium]
MAHHGMARRTLALISLALFWLFCTGCGDRAERWNVLIVTFDTTRADHIGCYGHAAADTPVVDRLAAEGVLFEHAIAPVPITLPSHSSLMTGKVPFAHGVRDNGLFVLGDEQTTLAEILRSAGYRTAAAIGAFPLTAEFGIDQGFELFDDHLASPYEDLYGQRTLPKQEAFFDERRASDVNAAALPWLEAHAEQPFFLWLHYFDPHHPHRPPAPYDELFAHDLYDGEIAYADESLGVVIQHLERLGVADRTVIVLTSDHGEGRGEHDEETHSLLTYQSTLHVPLVVRLPDGPRGRRVASRVSTIDILPTVLDVLGLAPPAEIQGRSLLPLIDGDGTAHRSRPIYAETLSSRLSMGWGELRALVLDGKKYIHGPRPELYDLDHDPSELDDLMTEQPELAEQMRQRLKRYLAEHAVAGLDGSVAADEETLRRLQALGYLQATGDRVGVIDERLRDDGEPPQDHASTISARSKARHLLFAGRALDARGVLLDLLRSDPGNPHHRAMLVKASIQLGDYEAALADIAELRRQDSGHPPDEELLTLEASALIARGETRQGLERLIEAEAIAPSASGSYRLASIHQELGEVATATRFVDAALELDPEFVPALVDRAIRFALEGDRAAAEIYFEDALAADPFFARGQFNYGVLLVETGRAAQAVEPITRAVQLRPHYHAARAALVEILVDLGRLDAATGHAVELERLAPGSAEAETARRRIEAAS